MIAKINSTLGPTLNNKWVRRFTSPSRFFIIAAVVLIIISFVREISGADDITSAGASGATLRFTVPLLMAGLGGLWSERAGVINIGLEGMMIAGTWLGAWFGFLYGPWTGLLAAAIGGSFIGLFHAFLTVKVGIDQAVSGLAINLLAMGTCRYLSGVYFVTNGGDINVSPQSMQPATFTVPGLSSALIKLEQTGIFFISDVAGIAAGLVTQLSYVTVICLLCVPITGWILWRTRFGLRMRFSGENPVAAESLGVNVYRTRFIALAVSGALASVGGAYLALVASNVYREGQTAGRGFIGLATVIFGNWRPSGVFAGSLLFGFTDALRVRQSTSVHAVILVVAFLGMAFAVTLALKKKWRTFVITSALSGLAALIYIQVKVIPDEFVTFFPNLTTILVLTFLSQRLRPPAMAGAPYRKGEEISV
ncbi:MAG: ABC transporter permease [Actinobacteria bacterium]|nr:ABC transporter permease [Actinomycetota bacterium]